MGLSEHDKEVAEFIQNLSMDELVGNLVSMIAATAYSGVLEHGKTPDEALQMTFSGFGHALAAGLERLRPAYEERCERDLFKASASDGLGEIDTISDADRAANRDPEFQETLDEIERISSTDPLTGLDYLGE